MFCVTRKFSLYIFTINCCLQIRAQFKICPEGDDISGMNIIKFRSISGKTRYIHALPSKN
jgi:hypothetical protein